MALSKEGLSIKKLQYYLIKNCFVKSKQFLFFLKKTTDFYPKIEVFDYFRQSSTKHDKTCHFSLLTVPYML